ncbi:hypothetical protein HY449_02755 [Candidatus Pacearchaeota archaeon]|nr:hypothetical protein [Candidatus Pacearchaeota archaeon]
MKKGIGTDILGNVAIVKFPKEFGNAERKKFAGKFLKEHKSVRTILEKIGKFQGRLRKQKTKFLLGEKTKEILYRENNCFFRFNADSTYFSPRLSNERKEISKLVKNGDDVLVMFAGVAPFSVAIAKNSKARKVYSVEINREATKYAKQNVELNRLKDRVEIVQGDVKNFSKKLSRHHPARSPLGTKNKTEKNSLETPSRFDVIVMPRPQLKESFLKEAFLLSKKGTRVFYYDFCKADDVDKVKEKIISEAKKAGKRIKIIKIKNAGDIGAYKFRVRVDFVVL